MHASRGGHEAQLSTMRTRILSSQGASAMPRMTSRYSKWMSLRIQSKHPAKYHDMHRCRPSTPHLEGVSLYLLQKSTLNLKLQKISPVSTSRVEQRAIADQLQTRTRSQHRSQHHRLLDIAMRCPKRSQSHRDIVFLSRESPLRQARLVLRRHPAMCRPFTTLRANCL